MSTLTSTSSATTGPASAAPAPAAPATATPSPTLAIANWDVVPNQMFAGELNAGVVAFHSSGIDRVDFSINGGPAAGVSQCTLNPQTGVNEYWCVLSADDFLDGPITISAIAHPMDGLAKSLPAITLYPNSTGKLTVPSLTVSTVADLATAVSQIGDGGIIFLNAGVYQFPPLPGSNRSNQHWITIAAAAGVAPDQVKLIAAPGAGRISVHADLVKFSGLTIDTGGGYLSGVQMVWLDNCVLTSASAPWLPAPANDPGQPLRTNTLGLNGNYQLYVTDSLATQTIYGFVNAQLVRNCTVHEITGDALQCSSLVLNTSVYDFAGTLVHHADVYQMWGDMDNVILCGIKTWNTSGVQGLFLQPTIPGRATQTLSNSAFVNVTLAPNDADGKGGPPFNQLQSRFRNLLFDNVQSPDQKTLFRMDSSGASAFDAQDVLFRNCTFHPLQNLKTVVPGVTFEGCKNGVSSKTNWPGLTGK